MSGLSISSLAFADVEVPVLKWKGDVRYRHEWVFQPNPTPTLQSAYQQDRLQFRLGAASAVTPTTDVEFRLASGTGRTTLNQTLGQVAGATSPNNFSNLGVAIDRAFFNWHGVDGLSVLGGRVKNTFYVAGGSDLIWDTDLNFDGLTATYAMTTGDISPFVTGAFYWADKTTAAVIYPAAVSPNSSDNQLVSLQVGAKGKMDAMFWGLAASYYDFTHMVGRTLIDGTNNKGNSTSAAGTVYLNDYRLLNFGGEFGTQLAELPVIVMFDYVINTAAQTEKSGYLAGLKVGKTKKSGDWAVAYDYRQLKKDAVVGAFTDGDTLLGSTDGHSHRVRVAYQANDAATAGVNLYIGQKGLADGESALNRSKAQVDLMFAF